MNTTTGFFLQKYIRSLAGIILSLLAFHALGGGLYGLAGANYIPIEWLYGSPFHTYFLPSLFLFVIIGGGCLTGAVMAFRNLRHARAITAICGTVLIGWIIAELSIIGYVSRLQPLVLSAAVMLVILVLAWKPASKS